MDVSRRFLLQGAGCALALASARSARAAGGLVDRTVPGTGGAVFDVLEIHFAGGLNHRETFWVERPDEAPVQRELGALNPPSDPILAPSGAPPEWLDWLPAMGAFTGTPYQVGTSGSAIHLGPCGEPLVRPLAGGDTLISRLRVVATGHDNEAHDPSQEYMLQGQPENALRRSGLGAAIARHSGRPSFVFYDSGAGQFLSASAADAAMATGFHGAEHAPFLVPYDDPAIVGLLSTPRVPQRDALSRLYNDRYELGLTFNHPSVPAGTRARSVSLDRYLASIEGAFEGPAWAAALSELAASTGTTLWDNGTRRAIRASAALLSAGLSNYCCVCDAGVVGTPIGSRYDAHSEFFPTNVEHAACNTGNVLNVLRTIRELVDAGTLDLSRTLVVLSTEFGRTFFYSTGSEHCHDGFAVALLGGPIPAGAGGIVGELPFTSSDDAAATEAFPPAFARGGVDPAYPVRPTDLRAAILLAAGIHPIQAEVYLQPETNTTTTDPDVAADQLATHIFGV